MRVLRGIVEKRRRVETCAMVNEWTERTVMWWTKGKRKPDECDDQKISQERRFSKFLYRFSGLLPYPPPPHRSIISIGTFVRTCEWVGGVSRSRRGVGRAVLLRPRILRYTADWMTYLWSLTRDNDTVYKNARVCVHGNLHAETATGRRRITPYAYGDFVGGRRQQYRLLPRGVAARQGVVDRADYVEYLKVWAFVRSLGKRVSKTYGNISNNNNNNDNDKCVTIIHCNIHSRRPSHQG